MGHLRIVRRGVVRTEKSSPNQCAAVGHHSYRYETKITVTDDNLDDNGFIVEHSKIQNIAQGVFDRGYATSCENYALDIAAALKKQLGTKLHIIDIYVKIRPVLAMGQRIMAYMEYSESGKF